MYYTTQKLQNNQLQNNTVMCTMIFITDNNCRDYLCYNKKIYLYVENKFTLHSKKIYLRVKIYSHYV